MFCIFSLKTKIQLRYKIKNKEKTKKFYNKTDSILNVSLKISKSWFRSSERTDIKSSNDL